MRQPWNRTRPATWPRTEWWIFQCTAADCGGGLARPPSPPNGVPRCPRCGSALFVFRSPEPPRIQRAEPSLIFTRPEPQQSYDVAAVALRTQERARVRLERAHRRAHAEATERARKIASEVGLSARFEHRRFGA